MFMFLWVMGYALTVDGMGSALMTLRVWAMYGRSRRVLGFLLVLLCLKLAVSVALGSTDILTLEASRELVFSPIFNTCIILSPHRWTSVTFVPWLAFDTAIFVLLLRKTWGRVIRTEFHSTLFACLFINGLGYYVVMLIVGVLNLVAFAWFPTALYACAYFISWCINATMVSRIFLNLKNTARPQEWSSLTAFNDQRRDEESQTSTEYISSDDIWA